MATNKNITMKQYNGTDYDVLYPKTKVSQVDGAVASVNNVTPDNTGAVKVDTFEQSIKIGKNVDVGTDGGASAVQFHFDGNANAYTSRIVESESGALTVEAILKLIQALGLEYGGTGATTAADACANLGAVKKSGDTMTGTLAIDRSSYPMISFNVNNNAKANVVCSSSDASSDGGIIFRGWSADGSAYKDLGLYYSNGMVVPVENGGTNATTSAGANQNLFNSGEIANATVYPTVPGIYRTVGTNIFSNLTDVHSNYGVLIIFKAVYALHLYIDANGYFFWGYSSDAFGEPTNWYGINRLSNNCYGAVLPSAGIPGRLFYKKV